MLPNVLRALAGPSVDGAAALLRTSSTLMVGTAALTFGATLLIAAPYGRHGHGASKAWGPMVPARLAWFIMESPSLWALLALLLTRECTALQSTPNKLLLGVFVLHYFQRAVVYPLRMRTSASPMPLSVMGMALLFCSWNGAQQGLALLIVHHYPAAWVYDPRFIGGLTLALVGMALNVHADTTLRRLRDASTSAGQLTSAPRYSIPRGGLFELVSCANYTAECLEWVGFAVACWSLPAAAFALYTFSNLGPRARRHHQWLHDKFKGEYPQRRTALIPFIF